LKIKEWKREDGFTISTNKEYLDFEVIHPYLSHESYWAKGISKDILIKSLENTPSCYGIYKGDPSTQDEAVQVGFARVITDFTRFSWLGDVFVLPDYRGKGLSKWLMHVITTDPDLEGTSFQLATKDAHGLYKQFGFQELRSPESKMERPINWKIIEKNQN
jgi:GNAT superfamily N-acetyltransferase